MNYPEAVGEYGTFMLERNFELVSKSRAPQTPWVSRVDPVHEILWQDMISRSWTSMDYSKNVLKVDTSGRLIHAVNRVPSPMKMSKQEIYSAGAIQAFAMLNEWNQLSTLQLSTLMGISHSRVTYIMWNLYSSGIVKRLIPAWWRADTDVESSGSGSFWRIDRKSWMTDLWLQGLDNLEWALLTHGDDPTEATIGANSPNSIRHNVATVEIALKAMEAIPEVIGAWGEGKVHGSRFYDVEKLTRNEMLRNNVGDAAIITRDGKIIVLETTGTNATLSRMNKQNPLVHKAAAWTSICGRTDLDLYVVFVDISRQQRHDRIRNWVDFGVKSFSERFITNKEKRERGQQRVLVADSRHWFPLPRSISTDFVNLRCYSTIDDAYVDLVNNDSGKEPRDSDHVINCLASLHTPTWIHRPI